MPSVVHEGSKSLISPFSWFGGRASYSVVLCWFDLRASYVVSLVLHNAVSFCVIPATNLVGSLDIGVQSIVMFSG